MLRVSGSALHSCGPPSGLCALANIDCFMQCLTLRVLVQVPPGNDRLPSSQGVHVANLSFLAVPCATFVLSWEAAKLWLPQGVPRVQYVNAKAADDEWPPKYWKVTAYR